jgi:hypothetical protein
MVEKSRKLGCAEHVARIGRQGMLYIALVENPVENGHFENRAEWRIIL